MPKRKTNTKSSSSSSKVPKNKRTITVAAAENSHSESPEEMSIISALVNAEKPAVKPRSTKQSPPQKRGASAVAPSGSPALSDIEIPFFQDSAPLEDTPQSKTLFEERVNEVEDDFFQSHNEVADKSLDGSKQKEVKAESENKTAIKEKEIPKAEKKDQELTNKSVEKPVAKLSEQTPSKAMETSDKVPKQPTTGAAHLRDVPAALKTGSAAASSSKVTPRSPPAISAASVMAPVPDRPKAMTNPVQQRPMPPTQSQPPQGQQVHPHGQQVHPHGQQVFPHGFHPHPHTPLWHPQSPAAGMPQGNGWNQPNSQMDPQYYPFHPPMGDAAFPGFYPYPPMHQPEFFVPYPPPHGYGDGFVDPRLHHQDHFYPNHQQGGIWRGNMPRDGQRHPHNHRGW